LTPLRARFFLAARGTGSDGGGGGGGDARGSERQRRITGQHDNDTDMQQPPDVPELMMVGYMAAGKEYSDGGCVVRAELS